MTVGHRRWGGILTTLALVAIAALTLTPARMRPGMEWPPWWCLWCGHFGLIDTLANVVLFIPLGIGFWLLRFPPLRAAGLALAVTAGIEILQLAAIAGRDANLRDILTNAAGAGVGYVLAPHLGILWRPSPRAARFLSAGIALAWIVSRLATGLVLSPSPPAGAWYGQLAPRDVYPENLDGQVHDAAINAQRIRVGRLDSLSEIITTWHAGEITVTAMLVLDRAPAGLASAFSVLSKAREEAFVLGVDRDDLVFRTRTRASDFTLRSPAIRLNHGISLGDTVAVTGALANRRLALSVGDDSARAIQVPLSAGLGWAVLSPFDVRLDEGSARWSALVVALALLLSAWFLAHALTLAWSATAGLLIAAAGFLLPPLLTVAAPAPLVEWYGGALGLLVGLTCHRLRHPASARIRQSTPAGRH